MILVHGTWHGSWCWASVTPHLAARGIPSVGVDLAGHGLNGRPPFARSRSPQPPLTRCHLARRCVRAGVGHA
ncbi:alpha/beta fold hydrolase [Streptosporangium sp. NPDC048865]|uniref:alpha/beta fold hydrolase n=1 Tax=Streptosporangium sp. NPDC048865 TaxID=3155766 RepID=UPI00342BF924